jgi:hypothetical protein
MTPVDGARRDPARAVFPAAVVAALAAVVGLGLGVVARFRPIGAPWAVAGSDVNLVAAVAAAACAGLARGHDARTARRALAATVLLAAAWGIGLAEGRFDPPGRWGSVPAVAGALVALLTAAAALPPRPWVPVVHRVGRDVAVACAALVALRLVVPPPVPLSGLPAAVARATLALGGVSGVIAAATDRAGGVRSRIAWVVAGLVAVGAAVVATTDGAVAVGLAAAVSVVAVGSVPTTAVAAARSAARRTGRATAGLLRRGRDLAVAAGRRLTNLLLPTDGSGAAPVARRLSGGDVRLFGGLVAVAALALAARVWWAYRVGAQPIGHGASVLSRSWDVGTADTTLVGMPTSYSDPGRGIQAYHPGPVFFDLMAPFVRTLGLRWGAFVGSAVLNLLWWAGATYAAFRAGGRVAGVAAWLGSAVVLLALIKGVVFDPTTVFPTVALIFACLWLCWAAASGWWSAWPWAVAACSVVTQAYLAHAFITALPVLWAGLAVWTAGRRWPEERGRTRRALAIGAGVLVLLWAQPVIEAAFNGGGNVRALWFAVTSDRPTVGARGWWEAPVWMAQLPPPWGRFDRVFAPDYRHYIRLSSAVGPLLLAAVAVFWGLTARQGDTAERRLRVLTVVVVLSSSLSLSQLPVAFTGFYQVLWLGVMAVFAWSAVGTTVVWWATRRVGARAPVVLRPAALAAAVVVVAVLALDTPSGLRELKGPFGTIDLAVPSLTRQVDRALDRGDHAEVLVLGMDRATEQTIADVLTADLIVRGRRVRVEPYIGSYFGLRRAIGADWSGEVLQVVDGASRVDPAGRMVARYVPDGWSRRRYDRAAERIREWALANGPIRVDPVAAPVITPYVDGWVEGLDCDDVVRLEAGDVPWADLPAGVFARLYADEAIASPQLPPELRRLVDRDLAATPTEVWLGRWDGRDGPLESARLLRDGSLCDPWAGG